MSQKDHAKDELRAVVDAVNELIADAQRHGMRAVSIRKLLKLLGEHRDIELS